MITWKIFENIIYLNLIRSHLKKTLIAVLSQKKFCKILHQISCFGYVPNKVETKKERKKKKSRSQDEGGMHVLYE